MRPKFVFLQIHLALRWTIGAVRINIPPGVAVVENVFKHIAIVDGCIRNFASPDDFVFDISLHMILIAVIVLSVFLNPAGIRIFLPFLCLAPILSRRISLFDRLVFVSRIELNRDFYYCGVDNLPFPRNKSWFGKKCIELVKLLPRELMSLQFWTEKPNRFRIRNTTVKSQIQKMLWYSISSSLRLYLPVIYSEFHFIVNHISIYHRINRGSL